MKKLFLLLCFCSNAFGVNITNYPLMAPNSNYWVFVSSVPDVTNYNVPIGYFALTNASWPMSAITNATWLTNNAYDITLSNLSLAGDLYMEEYNVRANGFYDYGGGVHSSLGGFHGDGIGLTNISITNITGGMILTNGDARNWTNDTGIYGNGSGLTNIPLSALNSPQVLTNNHSVAVTIPSSLTVTGAQFLAVSNGAATVLLTNGTVSASGNISTSGGNISSTASAGTLSATSVQVGQSGNFKITAVSPAMTITNAAASGTIAIRAPLSVSVVAPNSYVSGTLTATNGIVLPSSITNRLIDATATTNVFDDLYFQPVGINPVGLPNAAELVDTAGPNQCHLANRFAKTGTTVVFANPQMTHTWLPGTTVYPHFHICPQATNTGSVVWQVTYSHSDIDSTFYSTNIVQTTNTIASNSQYKHLLWGLPSAGLLLTNSTGPSTVQLLRIARLGDDAGDTYDDAIDAINFDVHIRWGGSPVAYNP